MNGTAHRARREMLGAFVLGHLDPDDAEETILHLDHCLACRTEVTEIAPLADMLHLVPPERLDEEPAEPPAELGDRVVGLGAARRRRGVVRRSLAVAASLVVATGVGAAGTYVLDRPARPEVTASPPATGSAPTPRPPGAAPPVEAVQVRSREAAVRATAGLVAHTWGTEIKLTGTGFAAGTTYRVRLEQRNGVQSSAGSFVGTGAREMRCNLNAAVLRADAAGFRVLGPDGAIVLDAAFE